MSPSLDRRVEIVESGRSGSVVYREAGNNLSFYWEFGGGDVLAIVQVNDAAWKTQPDWLAGRRVEILQFVADEVIRQKAPRSRADIDELGGVILLRQSEPAPPPPAAPDTAWVRRYTNLKMKLGLVVLVGALIFGAFVWFKNKVLVIDPGKGTSFGLSVRTDDHIATLIQTLVPYTPSLNRDHSKDEYRMSVLLVPLDGSSGGELIPITGDLPSSAFRLAKILGSDGRTLWFAVNGLGGIDLRSHALVTSEDLRRANPTIDQNWWEDTRDMEVDGHLRLTARDRSQVLEMDPETRTVEPATASKRAARSPFEPSPASYLAAGLFIGPNEWLGLHSAAEAGRQYKPRSWLRRVERAEEAKELRLLHRGVLDPDSSGASHKILSMSPIAKEEYLNAAFLRMDDISEPLRLSGPASALMMYTSAPGLKGTLMVARVDNAGTIIWKADTGIDRFKLAQILPGERSMAFIGTRPMVPDKVSEPLVVLLDNASGKLTTISLWQ